MKTYRLIECFESGDVVLDTTITAENAAAARAEVARIYGTGAKYIKIREIK